MVKRLFKKEKKYYDIQVENFFIELTKRAGRDEKGRFTKGNKYGKIKK